MKLDADANKSRKKNGQFIPEDYMYYWIYSRAPNFFSPPKARNSRGEVEEETEYPFVSCIYQVIGFILMVIYRRACNSTVEHSTDTSDNNSFNFNFNLKSAHPQSTCANLAEDIVITDTIVTVIAPVASKTLPPPRRHHHQDKNNNEDKEYNYYCGEGIEFQKCIAPAQKLGVFMSTNSSSCSSSPSSSVHSTYNQFMNRNRKFIQGVYNGSDPPRKHRFLAQISTLMNMLKPAYTPIKCLKPPTVTPMMFMETHCKVI